MGTAIDVLLPEGQLEVGLQAVHELFASWELTLSRFLLASELSELNRRAGEPVTVSPLLLHVLTSALRAAQATQGRYDPTLQSQLVQLGYDRSFDMLPASRPGSAQGISPGGGWRCIVVDHPARRVTLPADVGLDFGGIAKGMAVDAALTRLRELGIGSALVNAGGDLAVLGLPPHAQDWPIAVAGRQTSWTIPLHHGAMATSGIARRRWRQGRRVRHHLLNPQAGLPVRNTLWSVTVVAARCELAEVAAKTAFIAGLREGAALVRAYGLAGLFVLRDGTWRTSGSWPGRLMQAMKDHLEEHLEEHMEEHI
jgi:thiamine biosynthesis lipoprotein